MRLNTVADANDPRDFLYTPRPMHLPTQKLDYMELNLPILNQGEDGACTGFALAAVYHYCLKLRGDDQTVSPFYLYDLAKRRDIWPGHNYEGSSCRGALKAAAEFGACKSQIYKSSRKTLPSSKQKSDGRKRKLGAYFRVNHQNIHLMQAAICDYGLLYCSGDVHAGWDEPKKGKIKQRSEITGGHAFVIIGYDKKGFWLQNSWGSDYGLNGYCHLSFQDWLTNGYDAWIPVLAVS